jgi:hypothetical protein
MSVPATQVFVTSSAQINVVTVATPGPQGAPGITSPTTVALLPVVPTAGLRGLVSDATVTTFGTVVIGGGANTIPVYGDGVAWRIG